MIAQDKHRSALFLCLKRLRLFVVGVAHHFHHNANKQQYKLMPCGPHSLWGFRIFLHVNLLFHTLRLYSISAHLSTMIFSRRKMKDIFISFFCRFMTNHTLTLSVKNIFQHSIGQFVRKVKIHSADVKPLNPHMDTSRL